MILVDFSQISYSIIFQGIDSHGNVRESFADELGGELSPNLLRHLFLSNLLYFKKQFSAQFGESILCVDDKNPWRKKAFKHYKHKRKKNREKSGLDWEMIYSMMDQFKMEVRDDLRMKCIEVKGAEADDIIAVISKELSKKDIPVLILSSDKDFVQLQKYPGVEQYAPVQKKYIQEFSPSDFLRELIIRGDDSDGIPNVLSPLNSFVKGIRQKPVYDKKIKEWLTLDNSEIEDWTPEIRKRYRQNEILIDFSRIPVNIQKRILNAYEDLGRLKDVPKNMRESVRFSSYFAKHGLTKLFSRMSEF